MQNNSGNSVRLNCHNVNRKMEEEKNEKENDDCITDGSSNDMYDSLRRR